MKLSHKNYFVRMFHFFWEEYPRDFCQLFWLTLLELVIILGFLNTIVQVIIHFLDWRMWAFLLGLVVISVFIGLTVAGYEKLFGKSKSKPKRTGQTKQFLKDSWAALRGKYCVKIQIID